MVCGASSMPFGRGFCGPLLGPLGHRLHERRCAIHHHVALPVDGDDVVAVVEHHHVDDAPEVALQVPGVAEVGVVVLARMHDQRRLMDVPELLPDHLGEPAVLEHGAAGRGGDAGGRAVAAEQGLANELAHAVVLDAVRLDIGEGEEVGDALHGHEIEEAHVPGDEPAVEPEDGGKERSAMHVLGMAGGEQQRQHGTRRQAADDDGVAGLAHLEQGLLGAGVPVLPGRGLDVVLGAAMAGQLRAIDGIAGPRHAVGDVAHLRRGAAETMDQQHTHPIAADVVAVVLQNRHTRLVFPLVS